MIARMIAAVRCAFKVSAARHAASENNFELAKRLLTESYKILARAAPEAETPFDMEILRAQIEIGLRHGKLALESANSAREKLSNAIHLREADREYLIAYCNAIIEYCEVWGGIGTVGDGPLYRGIGANVEDRWKRNFPMPVNGHFTGKEPSLH